MLYHAQLKAIEDTVEAAVRQLFTKAVKNQHNENDMLLVSVHGFYDYLHADSTLNRKYKMSPYVFGTGEEGLTNKTQHDFFDAFLKGYLIHGDRTKYLDYQRTEDPQLHSYLIITQLELLAYLKFWESDYMMKALYNIVMRLLLGQPYDWHIIMRDKGKKNLLDESVRNAIKNKTPKFSALYNKIYFRQIRNAVAHSQFWVNNSYIIFTNYDPAEDHNLKRLSIEEWEDLFHHFVLFYRALSNAMRMHDIQCMEEAKDKHFGKMITITKQDGTTRTEFLKCIPEVPRWMWYRSWERHYLKKITIV